MTDCLFCKIISGEIPGSIVYEDDRVLAFNDINPQAPTHVLSCPKRHIASLNDLTPATMGSSARWCGGPRPSRRNAGSAAGGYRTVFNTNRDAGQTVFHIHLHLLGGRRMQWPPG